MLLTCSVAENERCPWSSCYSYDIPITTTWDVFYGLPFFHPTVGVSSPIP